MSTPAFNPAPGPYSAALPVTLSDATKGAAIHYTTDGSTPSSASTLYAGPIAVITTTTINAIATKNGFSDSAVASGTYTIQISPSKVATPTFSPDPGTYDTTQVPVEVVLSDATSGAAIHYTTDGSTPSSASTLYAAPIAVSTSTTINAIATASDFADSDVATATYSIGFLFYSGYCVVDPTAGTLTGECMDLDTCAIGASQHCMAGTQPNIPVVGAYCGPELDSTFCLF